MPPTPPPSIVPLLVAYSNEPATVRSILESSIGPVPELEPLSSISDLTPDMLSAPFDGGYRLVFAEEFGSQHYLEQLRAVAALFLEAKRREAIARRRELQGSGPCLDPTDHQWMPVSEVTEHDAWLRDGVEVRATTVFETCGLPGCDAIREVAA